MLTNFLRKRWPLVGMAILFAVVGLYMLQDHGDLAGTPFLPDSDSEEGLKLKNIHYTQDNPGDRVKWSLDAGEVKFSQDRQLLFFRNFLLKLEPAERPSIELQGKRADYNKNSGEFKLNGDLRGHTNNGYRIITDHMLYDHKRGFIKTETPVKIIGPHISVSGNGLYFDLKEEVLKIGSGVTTLIHERLFIS